ncbi:MAG: hypothetical protein QXG48_00910 [Thermofilaceae archaeon]
MVRPLDPLKKLLEPATLAPLAVMSALLLVSGIFNVFYTCLHDLDQCAAVHSRIGPVPGTSLQNTTEFILSFMGYAIMIYGFYNLYDTLRRTRRDFTREIAISLILIIIGTLLIAVMYYAKR